MPVLGSEEPGGLVRIADPRVGCQCLAAPCKPAWLLTAHSHRPLSGAWHCVPPPLCVVGDVSVDGRGLAPPVLSPQAF